MRIKSVQLRNFKRFTDLTISDIPESSKLVLLIGSNGSGKSSVFDAFDWLSKKNGAVSEYYRKNINGGLFVDAELYGIGKISENLAHGKNPARFIGRSSIRIVPRIHNNAHLQQVLSDTDSPSSYIDNDTRFINDIFLYIQNINRLLREPVFAGKQADTLKIFRDFINPFNQSLIKIFGGDETTTIQIAEFEDASPNSTAKLIFRKGESKINYDLLSHGEKQVVILLINFIVRQEYYKDSIIFIDEMDNHLNTALQATLLEEIVNNWIPDNSQFWTATHALGFIEYAMQSKEATIIDFNLLDFDKKQILYPSGKDKPDVYDIAIPKSSIASILKGYRLVVAENKNSMYYNNALGTEGYLFLPANNNREVFLTVKDDRDKIGLRDRDYLRYDEIEAVQAKMPNLKILEFYAFENYIYHPDNIEELHFADFDKSLFIQAIVQSKNERLIDIVGEIGTSRNHYIEFKDCIKNDENIKPITDALQSNIFEDFYPYFNMKKYFNKQFLSLYNYLISDLAGTDWFINQILRIIEGER